MDKSTKKELNAPIVVFHNDISQRLTLASLNSVEMDIFFSIIAALNLKRRQRGSDDITDEPEEVVLTFEQLKELSNYSQNSDTRFRKYLISIYEKILSLHFVIDTEESYTSFNLFSLFKIWDKKVKIVTNPSRRYILESLDKNFTIMKLKLITDVPTTAAKILVRLLSQYRSTGLAIIPVDGVNGIRNQFGCSETMPMKDITRRIIKPSVNIAKKYFQNLDFEYIREKTGSGRKIKSVKFTFKPGKGLSDEEYYFGSKTRSEAKIEPSANSCAVQTCPVCGQDLIERVMNGKTVWCHKDGYRKDAKCSKVFNTIAEIKGYKEIPTRKDAEEHTEHDEKELEKGREYAQEIQEVLSEKKDFTEIKKRLGLLD